MTINNKMKKAIIFLIIILEACNPSKRCARHLDKAKDGGCLTDSVVIKRDTLFGFHLDTVFYSDTIRAVDTFQVVKDGVKVTTVVKWKERIVTQAVTKEDTVFVTKYKLQTKIETKDILPWWVKLTWIVGIVIILGLALRGK